MLSAWEHFLLFPKTWVKFIAHIYLFKTTCNTDLRVSILQAHLHQVCRCYTDMSAEDKRVTHLKNKTFSKRKEIILYIYLYMQNIYARQCLRICEHVTQRPKGDVGSVGSGVGSRVWAAWRGCWQLTLSGRATQLSSCVISWNQHILPFFWSSTNACKTLLYFKPLKCQSSSHEWLS